MEQGVSADLTCFDCINHLVVFCIFFKGGRESYNITKQPVTKKTLPNPDSFLKKKQGGSGLLSRKRTNANKGYALRL
jgi:hypothetical protein